MPEDKPKDIGDFWMKILSLLLAIMVWFIIKTAAGLSYTNADTRRPSLNTIMRRMRALSANRRLDVGYPRHQRRLH